jgi:acetoin utilization deacetylase AcuC-like enzyme
MVRVYCDRRMLDHVPPSRHPERPERLATILRHLDRTGLSRSCSWGTVRPATDEELIRVHSAEYLAELLAAEDQGPGLVEPDTWLGPGSIVAARLAAGAAIEAVAEVVRGTILRALCLVRPPGHHARPDAPMGFCFFNSVAVAAAVAVERLGLGRVLIVDWDVHHGNGTQEIFYADPRVGFLSIHRYPFYPGSGRANETGAGPGLGSTRNVPLPFGISRAVFRSAFRHSLEEMAERIRPELVLLSAGFDAHAEDPVGSLGLEIEDFDLMTRDVLAVAEVHAGGRVVSILEGGYNLSILAGCVEAHLRALAGPAAP